MTELMSKGRLLGCLPPEALEIGQCYELFARDLARGIWDGVHFHGIRTRLGQTFMYKEQHWDLDDHHGTAQPLRKLT